MTLEVGKGLEITPVEWKLHETSDWEMHVVVLDCYKRTRCTDLSIFNVFFRVCTYCVCVCVIEIRLILLSVLLFVHAVSSELLRIHFRSLCVKRYLLPFVLYGELKWWFFLFFFRLSRSQVNILKPLPCNKHVVLTILLLTRELELQSSWLFS